MNKTELVKLVQEKLGNCTKSEAERSVEAVIEALKEGITTDHNVQIIGLGTFDVAQREAREGRNPRTGETMKIPASKTVKFKVSKHLKESL
jgi:nucleoid DNA-binding protein